jgi:hypothetical protein
MSPTTTFLLLIMGSSGCETTGLVALRGEDKQGCIGLVPAAALRERKINVELATKTLQDVAQGKFHLGYEDTIRTLLSDEILRVLIIPGITTVFIENCSGTIRHSPKARIVVRNSSIHCKQEHLK